jgi:hypothetical protein
MLFNGLKLNISFPDRFRSCNLFIVILILKYRMIPSNKKNEIHNMTKSIFPKLLFNTLKETLKNICNSKTNIGKMNRNQKLASNLLILPLNEKYK